MKNILIFVFISMICTGKLSYAMKLSQKKSIPHTFGNPKNPEGTAHAPVNHTKSEGTPDQETLAFSKEREKSAEFMKKIMQKINFQKPYMIYYIQKILKKIVKRAEINPEITEFLQDLNQKAINLAPQKKENINTLFQNIDSFLHRTTDTIRTLSALKKINEASIIEKEVIENLIIKEIYTSQNAQNLSRIIQEISQTTETPLQITETPLQTTETPLQTTETPLQTTQDFSQIVQKLLKAFKERLEIEKDQKKIQENNLIEAEKKLLRMKIEVVKESMKECFQKHSTTITNPFLLFMVDYIKKRIKEHTYHRSPEQEVLELMQESEMVPNDFTRKSEYGSVLQDSIIFFFEKRKLYETFGEIEKMRDSYGAIEQNLELTCEEKALLQQKKLSQIFEKSDKHTEMFKKLEKRKKLLLKKVKLLKKDIKARCAPKTLQEYKKEGYNKFLSLWQQKKKQNIQENFSKAARKKGPKKPITNYFVLFAIDQLLASVMNFSMSIKDLHNVMQTASLLEPRISHQSHITLRVFEMAGIFYRLHEIEELRAKYKDKDHQLFHTLDTNFMIETSLLKELAYKLFRKFSTIKNNIMKKCDKKTLEEYVGMGGYEGISEKFGKKKRAKIAIELDDDE